MCVSDAYILLAEPKPPSYDLVWEMSDRVGGDVDLKTLFGAMFP